ncbi:hypothetical protein D6764_03610 [Candidatus Woesearchaeota archaeon]|nr:MAG: hypothetical protein D6764_03610 [Candidatus Woesearchaeota archaeon]
MVKIIGERARRRNKKGYMRTIEAFSAVVITFVFMMYVIPQYQGNEVRREKLNVLHGLVNDDSFRNCVLEQDSSTALNCTRSVVSRVIPQTYRFKIDIQESDDFEYPDLPETRVFSESVMIAGNTTLYDPKYVRIYYWLR